MKTKEERINRILARGEVSGHCHVVIGDEVIVTRNKNGEIIIEIGNEDALLRHILETPWEESEIQIWTTEHKDIKLKKGIYKFVQQNEYDPYSNITQKNFRPVRD